MTPQEVFQTAYERVCAAFAVVPDAEQAREVSRLLEAYRASLYDGAATHLIRTFHVVPRPADWLDAVHEAQRVEEEREAEARERTWREQHETPNTFACAVCQDTGWEPRECTSANWCGICRRHGRHLYDHHVVTECACRATNPVYQRRRLLRSLAQPAAPTTEEARSIERRVRRGASRWTKAGE